MLRQMVKRCHWWPGIWINPPITESMPGSTERRREALPFIPARLDGAMVVDLGMIRKHRDPDAFSCLEGG